MLTCEPLLAKRVRVNSPKQASVGQVLRAGGEETKKRLSQKALKQSPTKKDEHLVSMWYNVNTKVNAILVIFEGLDATFKVFVELVYSLAS
jgi:polyphosphate kinase 2 (PPK2 family)